MQTADSVNQNQRVYSTEGEQSLVPSPSSGEPHLDLLSEVVLRKPKH